MGKPMKSRMKNNDEDGTENVIPNLFQLGKMAFKKVHKTKAEKTQEQATELQAAAQRLAAKNALLEQKLREKQLKEQLGENTDEDDGI